MAERSDDKMRLRDPVNVEDLRQRDKLVRRNRKIRADCVASKADIEAWNAAHPNETPIDTEFEDATIDWLDGKIPFPQRVYLKHMQKQHEGKIGGASDG